MPKQPIITPSAQEAIEKEIGKATLEEKEGKEAKALTQLVVFELDKEEYAVNISEIREVMKMMDITPIPNSPEFIEGIINIRGKIAVVIDLEKRFNLVREHKSAGKHIVVSEMGESAFGMVVDEVTEVLRIPTENIEAAPAIISEKIQASYVKGVAILDKRLLILLDLKKVLEEKELAELGKIVNKQARIIRAKAEAEKPEEEEKKETEAERKARVEKLVKEKIKPETEKPAYAKASADKPAEPTEKEKSKAEKVEKE